MCALESLLDGCFASVRRWPSSRATFRRSYTILVTLDACGLAWIVLVVDIYLGRTIERAVFPLLEFGVALVRCVPSSSNAVELYDVLLRIHRFVSDYSWLVLGSRCEVTRRCYLSELLTGITTPPDNVALLRRHAFPEIGPVVEHTWMPASTIPELRDP